MDINTYKKIMSFWERHNKLLTFAQVLHYVLVGTVYLAFPSFLLYIALKQDTFFITAFSVCLISFILLSLYRKTADKKRPSEVYGMPSAIKKDKSGKSFPSRHSFSAAVISVCLFHLSLPLGLIFLSISVLIAALRVFLGLHFVKDVVAGLLIGALCGFIALII